MKIMTTMKTMARIMGEGLSGRIRSGLPFLNLSAQARRRTVADLSCETTMRQSVQSVLLGKPG